MQWATCSSHKYVSHLPLIERWTWKWFISVWNSSSSAAFVARYLDVGIISDNKSLDFSNSGRLNSDVRHKYFAKHFIFMWFHLFIFIIIIYFLIIHLTKWSMQRDRLNWLLAKMQMSRFFSISAYYTLHLCMFRKQNTGNINYLP